MTTLPARLLALASSTPTRVAYRRKRLGIWEETTFAAYADEVAALGMGLVELGVRPGDRVAVQSDNRPEWLLLDLAVQGIGAVTVGVGSSRPAADVAQVLRDCGASAFVAEDEEQLDKVLAVRSQLPDLRHVLVVDPPPAIDPSVVPLADVLAPAVGFSDRVATLDPVTPATILYPAGAAGAAAGVVRSHDDLSAVGAALVDATGARADDEVLSYLPLDQIAERTVSLVAALHAGYTVNFGDGADSFTADLREVQPTLFVGVPRVWEELRASTETRVADASWAKRRTYRFWVAKGRARAERAPAGKGGRGLGWLVLFRPLREKLGMSRVRAALSGGPVDASTLEWLWALGVPVREAEIDDDGTVSIAERKKESYAS